jgi:hypothetical protein
MSLPFLFHLLVHDPFQGYRGISSPSAGITTCPSTFLFSLVACGIVGLFGYFVPLKRSRASYPGSTPPSLHAKIMPAVCWVDKHAQWKPRYSHLGLNLVGAVLGNQNQGRASATAAPFSARQVNNDLLTSITAEINEGGRISRILFAGRRARVTSVASKKSLQRLALP